MAGLPHEQPEFIADPTVLYVRKLSRFSFEAIGDLREAFLEMYNESARRELGQQALFLYSQPQIETFRPNSNEARASEHRDSMVKKRLGSIASRQFELAKWVEAVRNEAQTKTGFRLNVLLDPDTQMQLHAGLREGLNQVLFGRKAITATLWIPDKSIISTAEERREASRVIKQVIWGNDEQDSEQTILSPPASGHGGKVAHIDWKSRIVGNPTGRVA